MRITKLLSSDSAPAQALIQRAKSITLTMAERVRLPQTFKVGGSEIENALGEVRPLEVGDILVDEAGSFYKIEATPEAVLKVTGDVSLMQEAVYAFMARGLRVAQTEEGFAVVALPQFKEMLEGVGLTVTESEEPFEPLPVPRHGGGCGCGCGGHGHHHHDEGECGCGCGGHHHHDDDECGCGCGGHHHHDDEECGCGGHHDHQHGDGQCCCGGHDHEHEHEGECCCGHDHEHKHEDQCCCGHDHEHKHEGECTCGCDKK